MNYCPNCQSLCDEEETCPYCGNKKLRQPEKTDPVLLVTADETRAGMIEAAFQTAGLPYEERFQEAGGVPSVVFGRVLTNKNLFVPYGMLESAKEIVEGISSLGEGLDENELDADEQQGNSDIEETESEQSEDEGKRLSPTMRTVVRIVSVILFILVIWGVVTVSDYAANALKGFFSNL